MLKRKATAVWKGTGPDGSGQLNSTSGAWTNLPYSFRSRFENEAGTAGTNPEELIAAAHAGCFAMALSFGLGKAGFTPDTLETEAIVSLDKGDSGFSISGIKLILTGSVPGIDAEKFREIAEGAKANCPVSRALSAVPIELEARLA